MLTRIARAAAATVVASAALVGLQAAPASALTDCPHGQEVCVYLPAGSYTLGNPVTTTAGTGPASYALLHHCNSTGTDCDTLYLNLPGLQLTSTETTVLTLHVPGQGIGLSGITPTLYVGVPTVSPGSASAGLTLRVQGTTFVVWDTAIDRVGCISDPLPPNPFVNGDVTPCGFDLTVTV